MYNQKPILERAFELARTGQFINVKMVEKALAKEGYAKSDMQLSGSFTRRQLRDLCRAHYPYARVEEEIAA